MSDYNAILELGMQNGLCFPVFFTCFIQHIPLLPAWNTQSLLCLWGGNVSAHDCPCAHSALTACAPTNAISSCWG